MSIGVSIWKSFISFVVSFGAELISPEDLLQACSLWKNANVPVMLRKFDSGVMVIQNKSYNDEKFSPLSPTLLALISSILYEPSSSSIINPSKAKQVSSQPRSAVADNESGKSKLSEVRTSSGMFIAKGKEFELRLKQVFCIYDIEEMVFRMANQVWTVPIDDLCLDAQIFSNFVAALQLQFLDYLLVIMLSTVEF
ncbi:hypothetical protein RHGRI_007093 [Rhododendron griersonianum]|uniref:Vacuolar protein-sorting-associated protein 36 n=1 Tax=Rhododendron griersonianum TaxID=479676 RepID=A0AAV6KVQ6_9ERIC|nr:hypothetical protein RHGRI_007093 [Rhododendron griersonianum]